MKYIEQHEKYRGFHKQPGDFVVYRGTPFLAYHLAVAGIYIREIKSVRGGSIPKVEEKKKGFFAGLRDKAQASIAKNSK